MLEALRHVARVESTESSNRLEGIEAPHPRVEALVLKNAEPRNRSEQEIAGYRDALALIHESNADIPFAVSVILQPHSTVYSYLPSQGGRFKMTDNEIIERNPDGSVARVRFRAVPAVATPQAMDDLAQSYKEAIQVHRVEPLVVVPLAILDLLCIHPFADGNGRVARLLTLLLLYHLDYSVGRYISLERIVEESKQTYYESLESSSQGWHEGEHDPRPWLNYFWGALLKAYGEFEERVGTIRAGKGSKTAMVRAAVVRRSKPFSLSELQTELPTVSRDMLRHVLRKLKAEGQIESVGQGRGAKWVRREQD